MAVNNTSTCFFFETISRQYSDHSKILKIFCVVLHALTFVLVAFDNGLIVLTTFKNPSFQKPSFVLLSCAAFADFLTGFLAQPVAVAHFVTKLRQQTSLSCLLGVMKEPLGWLFSGISVSILAILSVERHLVLHLGLRYGRIVTIKRLFLIYWIFWLSLIFLAVLRFHVLSNNVYVLCHLPFMFLCLFILTLSYCRINYCIRKHGLVEPSTSPKRIQSALSTLRSTGILPQPCFI